MTSLLIEDTPRNNLAAWATDAIAAGSVAGIVSTPFCSPAVGNTYKPSARSIVDQVRAAGGDSWFDPMTHALQMPGVGDFRYYDQWDLWGDDRGSLVTRARRREHVRRVFEVQASLGCPFLVPTVLISAPAGQEASIATDLLEEAAETESACWGTIAGSPNFWASNDELDALVGTFAQMDRPGWFLVVVRANADLPIRPDPGEVAGLCRTIRSLAARADVHVSHGDLGGLPAVAAGARSLGTGWDTRQRVCQYGSYEERDAATGGGGWFKRPTLERLVGFLSRNEVERIFRSDSAFAEGIFVGELHPDGPKEAFLHHVASLAILANRVDLADEEARFRELTRTYEDATGLWPEAATLAGIVNPVDDWVTPFLDGLTRYGSGEGWT